MKEKLRAIILDRFDLDIDKVKGMHSSGHYTFLFPEGSKLTALKIKIADTSSRELMLAKALWADDLRLYKNTICEPVPSYYNNLIEEFTVSNRRIIASRYNMARGHMIKETDIKPILLINVGEMLGAVHAVSRDQVVSGFKYKINNHEEYFNSLKESVWDLIKKDVQERIEEIFEKVASLEKNEDNYGICYGDFEPHNLLADNNNIYLYDFDSAMYCYYMYDIATFMMTIIISGYMEKVNPRDIVYKYLVRYFNIGYNLNKVISLAEFDVIGLFMAYRACIYYMELKWLNEPGTEDVKRIGLEMGETILMEKDVFEGLRKASDVRLRHLEEANSRN